MNTSKNDNYSSNCESLGKFFIPTKKDSDEFSETAKLMMKSGMIHKLSSGIYAWLPLGYKILSIVEKIISDKFEDIGFNRMCLPTLHPASLWIETGRYEVYGKEMLKIKDRNESDLVFGPTAEEACVDMVRNKIKLHDLPVKVFNIQWKFRDELRPRYGIVRCREFLMCDGYSFHETEKDALDFYDNVSEAYKEVFDELGLDVISKPAETGEIGGSKSHEFLIESEIGEDTAVVDGVEKSFMELGHIFLLGTRYSEPMNLKVTNSENKTNALVMSCYGIGVSRLVGALVEKYSVENGINWPKNIAPFKITILNMCKDSEKADKTCEKIRRKFSKTTYIVSGKKSPGEKFAVSDLIGSPIKIIIGNKQLESDSVEVRVISDKTHYIKIDEIIDFLDKVI
ncbi:aminoacyl--tRNA ligase-related protein [Candidatus Nesciobacter abundans]|nr:aminoacyl--tRNA ligase-related protein [Candidatus Nesciobacter abundans]